MSALASDMRDQVWRVLQDNRLAHVVSEDFVRQTLMETVVFVASHVGLGNAWVSAFTTSTTGRDYTLTSGVEYAGVLDLRYASDQQPLHKVSRERILVNRVGPSVAQGRQLEYALAPTDAQTVEVSFAGLPSEAEMVQALVSVVPTDWPKGAGTVPTVPFSLKAVKGTQLLTAAAIFDTLGDDKRTSLDLGPNSGKSFAARGMALVDQAMLEVIRLKVSNNTNWLYEWGCM
jgi:hypothetical protein